MTRRQVFRGAAQYSAAMPAQQVIALQRRDQKPVTLRE